MIDFYQEFGIQNLDKILTPIINIGFWFIFFMLFVIFAYMIKYLFHKGFKNYCKMCIRDSLTHMPSLDFDLQIKHL